MWSFHPSTLPLRLQILQDIAECRTPSGCVQTPPRARRKSHPEWDDVAAERDERRDTEPS